jgi:hypothetical protein
LAGLFVGDGSLGTPKGAVTLQAGQGQSVLEVLQLGGRDEDGRRDAAICQGDVLVLGGSAGEVAELAPAWRWDT